MSFTLREDPHNRAVYLKINKCTTDIQRGIRQGYYFLGKRLRSYASKKMLEKPKHGRTYYIKRGNTYRKHIASAPWEYPANMTGKLRRSLDFAVHGHQQLEFGANTFYARYLELGTKKMLARKFLRQAIIDNSGIAYTYFEREIRRNLSKPAAT